MADEQNPGTGCVAVGLGLGLLALLGLFLVTLPNWLASGASKARQSEGSTYVGALNRAQQAYHLEHNQFSSSFDALGTGMPQETERFAFSTIVMKDWAVQSSGMAKQRGLHDVVGLVWRVDIAGESPITNSQLCKRITAAHEPDNPALPRWLREMFQSQRYRETYPTETPPQFELSTRPASPDIVISCPDGYESY
ncbi:MAG: type IV pilin-like G/H family protein [Cyanobacteria bacterium J06632_22]